MDPSYSLRFELKDPQTREATIHTEHIRTSGSGGGSANYVKCEVNGCWGNEIQPSGRCIVHTDGATRYTAFSSMHAGEPLHLTGVDIDASLAAELFRQLPEWKHRNGATGGKVVRLGLHGCTVRGRVDLQHAEFIEWWAIGCEFHEVVLCMHGNYDPAGTFDPSFEGSRFHQACKFDGVRFVRPASFENCAFSRAQFVSSHFERGVSFDSATADGDVWIGAAEFGGDANLSGLRVAGSLDVVGCDFSKELSLDNAQIGADCLLGRVADRAFGKARLHGRFSFNDGSVGGSLRLDHLTLPIESEIVRTTVAGALRLDHCRLLSRVRLIVPRLRLSIHASPRGRGKR